MFAARCLSLALAAAATLSCASFEPRTAYDRRPRLAGESVGALVPAAPTSSFALDRIYKRRLALDGTVRRTATGRGVSIYVFDGGVAESHPELFGRVRIGYDAFPSVPRICNAHGTAVAGAAAGATLGVAPDARIVDVKIIACRGGRGSVDAIVEAARWVVEDHRLHPNEPAVANWSFVVDTMRPVPGIDTAITMLRDAGILVVASAGNFDIDACRVSPANARIRPLVVGASSLRQRTGASRVSTLDDARTPDTAWGSCIDLYAPGDSVLLPMIGEPGTTALWTGTSMAAGFVSGAAALVLQATPTMQPDDIARMLIGRATPSVVDESHRPSTSPAERRARLLYVGLE